MNFEHKKLNILVAIDEVPSGIWDRLRPLANLRFVREGLEAYRLLTQQTFDVMLIDLHLTGMDSLDLLRRSRTEKLCESVILTSLTPSFSYAQQGILYGVSAYLLRPLKGEEVEAAIRKLQSVSGTVDPQTQEAVKEVIGCLRKGCAPDMFLRVGQHLLSMGGDAIEHGMRWRDFCEELIRQTFQRYPWLHLYHHPSEFAALDDLRESDDAMVINFCLRKVQFLSDAVTELFPRTKNVKMEDILIRLLQSVDQNIQQKDIAEQYFITNSTLSTRFQRNLGISYREYMTWLKIRRGQYLLRFTDISPEALAPRLGYKDKEYFSKLFLQRTGESLQECGRKNWGDYDI